MKNNQSVTQNEKMIPPDVCLVSKTNLRGVCDGFRGKGFYPL